MDVIIESIIDFVRVRQLNIVLAGVLTLVYLVYQYWGVLFKSEEMDDEEDYSTNRISRSRSRSGSRSRSRADSKLVDSKYGRRGRRSHQRCPDCRLCNPEK